MIFEFRGGIINKYHIKSSMKRIKAYNVPYVVPKVATVNREQLLKLFDDCSFCYYNNPHEMG